MAEPSQQDHQRPEAAIPPGGGQATAPNQPTTSSIRDGSTAPTEDARNPTKGNSNADRMEIEETDELAMQLGSTDMTIQGREQSASEPLQPDNTVREPSSPLKPPPGKDTVMGTTMTPDEIKEARKQWREAGRPDCLDCKDKHPPPCDPEIAAEKLRLEDLKNSNPEEWTRVTNARKTKREQKIVASNQTNAENQQKQNEDATAGGKPRRQRIEWRDSLTNPKAKMPKDWCMRCLACHQRANSEGAFHTLPWHEAEAIHQAIQNGERPRVNPLEHILAAAESKIPSMSKPATAQFNGPAAPLPPVEATWEGSDKIDAFIQQQIEGKSTTEAVNVMLQFLNNQDARNIANAEKKANASRPQGSYASAAPAGSYHNPAYPTPGAPAPQPTEPLPKKRKAQLDAVTANKKKVFKGQKPKPVKAALGGKKPNPSTDDDDDDSMPAQGSDQPQPNNSLKTVQTTGQRKAISLTNVPQNRTTSKLPAKGDASAALQKANDDAAKTSASSDNAAAKPAAGSKAAADNAAPDGKPT